MIIETWDGTWKGEATATTEHAASSYGQPVLLIRGEPVGTGEAALAGYRVVEGTVGELELLRAGGYLTMIEA